MGFAALTALVGLVFGMISIKLMSMVENAQIVVGRGVRKSGRLRQGLQSDRVVAFAMSAHRLFFLRVGISFFGWISSLIFVVEAMYPEKVVEGAAFAMMKTVVLSNRIRVVTVRGGRHAMRKMRMTGSDRPPQGKGSPIGRSSDGRPLT